MINIKLVIIVLHLWFSTGVPWACARGAANPSDYLPIYGCRQISALLHKCTANWKKVEKHCSTELCCCNNDCTWMFFFQSVVLYIVSCILHQISYMSGPVAIGVTVVIATIYTGLEGNKQYRYPSLIAELTFLKNLDPLTPKYYTILALNLWHLLCYSRLS